MLKAGVLHPPCSPLVKNTNGEQRTLTFIGNAGGFYEDKILK